MKFSIIVGTRPQIIKTQPIIHELISKRKSFSLIHTGQHYDYKMSQAFFKELKIRKPDFNLGVSKGSSSSQLAEIIRKLEKILIKTKPDVVIIPGDTRSALGGALAANRLGIKLAHIEAGARSNDFGLEEEINRRIIDHCSNFLFAPTKNCENNLKKESTLGSIFYAGDTMYDVFQNYKKILNLEKSQKQDFVLMTIHRRQNILNKNKIKKIIDLTNYISKKGYRVIFPIHPHTKKQIRKFKLPLNNIEMIEPVHYSKMLILMSQARLLLTDSGGLQKESFWLGTPCFTFRNSTEWIETLTQKNNKLVTQITSSTQKEIAKALNSKSLNKKSSLTSFGTGKAAKKIISLLLKHA